MNWFIRLLLGLVLMVNLGFGCSEKKSTNPSPPAGQGKITATASGISGQNGSTYMVAVYAYDWSPGAADSAVAGFRSDITVDSYSSTEILHPINSQWNITADEKIFEPGTYSVVFFVSPPGSPPQHFTEVRIQVNGDVTVTAPAWANWTHPAVSQ